MMRTLDDVREVCAVNNPEAALLTGSVRPIVLLKKLPQVNFAAWLADKLPELGVMLPYTPVQHILLHDFAEACRDANPTVINPPMLVMTSGNLHDEPIVIDDAAAERELAGIADAILGNNRAIVTRFDDSVVRVLDFGSAGEAVQVIRRARGYAPEPIALSKTVAGGEADEATSGAAAPSATIFATGPEQKNTFAFLRGRDAYVSQHVGDMESAATFDAWLETKAKFEQLFKLASGAVACDLHPEYLTTKWAVEACEKSCVPLVQVQHHFAHVASAMVESGAQGPVCGIAFDGTGYGADGNIWGGEVLIANLSDYERFINFAYVPMPGGAAAIKSPLRMAYGVLWEFDLLEHVGAAPALEALGETAAGMCEQMIEAGINTPYTSSVGRLFDAASALLGVCPKPTYEGEAAILLEAAIYTGGAEGAEGTVAASNDTAQADDAYEIAIVKNTATETSTAHDTSVVLFDAAPTFAKMLDDFAAGVPVGEISRRFHNAFVQAIVQAAELARAMYGIEQVVLTGGVFMNRYIMERAVPALAAAGFTVILNRDLPPNDGCISLGQAAVAAHQLAV
jgi:hydrogenase maturation protein HypF